MIKLIVGTKGSGKTKTMIDLINEATKTATGNVVVIEKSMQLTTSINHAARLVDVDEYKINGAEMLYGFVAGVLAGNYDITEMFIDGILKVCGHDLEAAGRVLNAINAIAGDSVNVTVTVSADVNSLPESIKKFL
ncbi:MAG: ATP-binding protein [Subdoligranulum sp.]|nr:ATP-binding protein [Subdoligranulum sp.]MCI7542623.1 ATP-binding protein [Subdoligranulum sp.]MDD7264683.1 ATP-binding protein [Subdoligranulum sp.]MDY5923186.1 ATP-binding protein [Oscillospiraceae bacterium]